MSVKRNLSGISKIERCLGGFLIGVLSGEIPELFAVTGNKTLSVHLFSTIYPQLT